MARCSKCGTDVGCACNLIDDKYCVSCSIKVQTEKQQQNVIPTNKYTEGQKEPDTQGFGGKDQQQAPVSDKEKIRQNKNRYKHPIRGRLL